MLQIPYEKLLEIIQEKSDLSKDEITKRVSQKLDEFSGLISQEGALHVVAHDLGVSLVNQINEPFKIDQISENTRGINLKAKIIKKYHISTFQREGSEGKVGSILVGDDTGVMRITFWHDQTTILDELEENSVYQFEGLTSKENQGRVELTYSQSCNHTKLDEELEVVQKQPQTQNASKKKIAEVKESDFARFVGVIVQVLKPTIYIVDLQTQKRVRIQFSEFDETKHRFAAVCNILLDDGTEVIRCACFDDVCEAVFQTKVPELAEHRDNETFFEEKKVDIVGSIVELQGRITKNDLYDRLECIASTVTLNPDPNSL